MRKISWIYYLLFLLALLLLLLFFRDAIPRIPQTEPTPDEQAYMSPQEEEDSCTLLLCDPSAVRGTEIIVINIPTQGAVNALYISGSIEVKGSSLAELLTDGPQTVVSSLSPYITIDHYVLLDMSLVDDLVASLNLADQQLSHTEIYTNILLSSGQLLQKALQVADNIQTDLPPVTALRLVNQLNKLSPADIQLTIITATEELEESILTFKNGR